MVLGAVAALLLTLFMFGSTLAGLSQLWESADEPYSHGYLVVALVLYWVIKELRQSPEIPIAPSLRLSILIVFPLIVWLVGLVTQIQTLEQMAIPAIIIAWSIAVLGWPLARKIIIPLLFLYLAIPIWDIFITPLRVITVEVVQWWLDLLNLPAYINGFYITIPAGTFLVAGGCAGLNYWLTGTSIGCFYAYMNIRSRSRRILCVLLSIVFALVGNWIRVFSLVLIGHYSGMNNPVIRDHANFGWLVFAAVFAICLYLLRYLDDPVQMADEVEPAVEGTESLSRRVLLVAVVVTLVSAVLPVWNMSQQASLQKNIVAPTLDPGLGFVALAEPDWVPLYAGYDIASHWQGRLDRTPATLTLLTYYEQRQGKELIYYSNVLAEEGRVKDLGVLQLDDALGLAYSVLNSGGQSKLVLWSYRVGGWYTSSPLMAKLMQLPQFFTGGGGASLVVLSMPCDQRACGQVLDKIESEGFIASVSTLVASIRIP